MGGKPSTGGFRGCPHPHLGSQQPVDWSPRRCERRVAKPESSRVFMRMLAAVRPVLAGRAEGGTRTVYIQEDNL